MRDIKFRSVRKDGFGMAIGNLVIDAYDKTFIETKEGTHLYTVKVDKNTVGQFTGFTDKNGKDIYEGDILKGYKCVYPVVFKNGAFIWDDVFLGYEIEGDFDANVHITDGDCITLEIVGNIHEHDISDIREEINNV